MQTVSQSSFRNHFPKASYIYEESQDSLDPRIEKELKILREISSTMKEVLVNMTVHYESDK